MNNQLTLKIVGAILVVCGVALVIFNQVEVGLTLIALGVSSFGGGVMANRKRKGGRSNGSL